MSDYIGRQAAIDALSTPHGILYPIRTVEELPSAQPEPQWIPCSKRLPETDKVRSYWVCTDGGYQCQCRWSNDMYGLGANEYSEWGWHIMDKPQYARVIAWMPLPESYQERRKND